jgi:prevent-host-death family protein
MTTQDPLILNVERTTFNTNKENIMAQHVGLREVNQHLSHYIALAEKGEEIIVMRRGQPIVRISPIQNKKNLTEEQKAAWERTRKRMEKGFNLGGKGVKRDELYE